MYSNLKKIVSLINKIAKADQAMRIRMRKTGKWDPKVDKHNTREMKKIVSKYGWPTTFLVGKEASHNAWLLVQHADHDVNFQEKCLQLMQKEFTRDSSSVLSQNIAYLTDRVAIRRNKRQVFGTQYKIKPDKSLELLPVRNMKKLNVLRKQYGLQPIKTYEKTLRKLNK